MFTLTHSKTDKKAGYRKQIARPRVQTVWRLVGNSHNLSFGIFACLYFVSVF